MKRIITTLFIGILISSPCFAKSESSSRDAASVVLYGNNNGSIVPIKVDADGIIDVSGGGDSITVAGVAATDPNFIAGGITWTLDTAATPDTIVGTVATNANLTGEVTSVGNAATIADSVAVTSWNLTTPTITTSATVSNGGTI